MTVESFLAWRQKWDAEMKLLKEKDIMVSCSVSFAA